MKTPILLITLMFLVSIAFAVQKVDTITIEVEVSELTLVDINPASLTWTSIPPGGVGEEKAIQIENIGSTNITHVWFNNTYPDSRPFGSGNNGSYDAGNYVVIRRNTSGAEYYFPNRVDYNESNILIYLTPPANSYYGRFRNSSFEYFWAVTPDGNGQCNSSGATFYIGKVHHNQTQTGSTDFSTCDNGLTATGSNPCRQGSLNNDGEWGWADVYVGPNSGYQNYTVAVYYTCDKVMFYHWNKDAPGASSATHAEYFTSQTLTPGASIIANVRVYVPYGVAAGWSSPGTLTVIAESSTST